MKRSNSSTSRQILVIILVLIIVDIPHVLPLPLPVMGTCHDTCGSIPIKYPFGSGSGCGHPSFSHIKCSPGGDLQLWTSTGTYTLSSIDYAGGTAVIADPLMSTCSSMQNSGSFALDPGSPFEVAAENMFALVGCSTTSPVFDPDSDFCDTGSGQNVCRGLYSCEGVEGIGLEPHAPISTCCVYEPLGLGLGLDLPKLQCSSYSAVYGFGGSEGDPMRWQYGILLRFNHSYDTSECRNCEESGGLCGFQGFHDSFACSCRNAVSTTVNCYGRSGTVRSRAGTDIIQTPFIIIAGFLHMWMIAFF